MSPQEKSRGESGQIVVHVCGRCRRCFEAVTGEVPKAASHMRVQPTDILVLCNGCNKQDMAVWPRG